MPLAVVVLVVTITEDGEPVQDLHGLHSRATRHGVYAWCRCGEWEGWWSGKRSEAMARDDHAHHARKASNGHSIPPVQ